MRVRVQSAAEIVSDPSSALECTHPASHAPGCPCSDRLTIVVPKHSSPSSTRGWVRHCNCTLVQTPLPSSVPSPSPSLSELACLAQSSLGDSRGPLEVGESVRAMAPSRHDSDHTLRCRPLRAVSSRPLVLIECSGSDIHQLHSILRVAHAGGHPQAEYPEYPGPGRGCPLAAVRTRCFVAATQVTCSI